MNNRVILAVTNDLNGDQRVHKVAMSLIRFGYQPELVGRLLPRSVALDRPYRTRRFKLLFRKGPLFYAEYNFRLFVYLIFTNASTFLANDLDTLPAVYLAGCIRRKKVVYDSHEYFTEVPELVGRKWVKQAWTRIERSIFPHLKNVYTVNRSIADIYESKYYVSVKVIRNVPLASRSEPVTGTLPDWFMNHRFIIYQGAVNVGRGIEEMIRALPGVPDIGLLIIGDGDIRKELERLTENLGLDDQVYFAGKLPYDQLSWYTRKAVLGMSLEQEIGLNYHYALPNKIFDYMQAGVPVIASNLPEIRHVVEEVGFGKIIDRFDPDYLSHTLNSILSDSAQLGIWRERALAAAPRYTWESEEKELLRFFPKWESR